MKFTLIFLLFNALLIHIHNLTAQTPEILWQHTYGGNGDDRAQDILATDDGGYITIGYSPSTDGDIDYNHGLYDVLVIKTDGEGEIIWSKTYGGSDYDYGNTICKGIEGGYVLGCSVLSDDGDITFNHGGSELWLVKINETGDIEWEKCFGGSEGEGTYKIKQTTDENYIVVGASSSSDGDVTENKGGYDYWIIKIDIDGEIIWQKTYGSSEGDIPNDILQTADNGFIVAGYTLGYDGDVSENKGINNLWIIKLDSTGILEWQKTYGGSNEDEAYSIVEKPEGGYMCLGVSYSNNGDVSGSHGFDDYWLISLDESGELEWQKCFGGENAEDGRCIISNYLDGYVLVGVSTSDDGDVTENKGQGDYWILQIDSTGNIIWQKSIGGSGLEFAHKVIPTLDNNIVITGYSGSSDFDVTATYSTYNFWTVKLGICEDVFYADTDGDGFGDVLSDTIACDIPVGFVIDSTDCNDADNMMNPAAIDICNGVDDNCNGTIDEDAVFIAYYIDADGDGFGNPDTEEMFCFIPSGYVTDNTDCDDTNENIYPGAPEILNGIDDNCDGVIDEGVAIETIDGSSIILFPNPANTTIQLQHNVNIKSIITRNNIGETVEVIFENNIASISHLPAGIYFTEIIAEEGTAILKWLKE
ncbi:MAG: T9SS type A sorting domain-containing protein [Bacteroidetes bacterium]|nr:T9SS type A sorting domain-containing protein [Bacteroidota bacterium]